MTTKDIYDKFMVPKSLREHMLRVASLAKIILDQWKDSAIDKNAIMKACVFHDIAKPMTFDLAKQAQFGSTPEEIVELSHLQQRLKEDYGENEHAATVKICQEIGLSSKSVELVNNLEWSYIPKLLDVNDIESLVPIYADMRIGPKGILALQTRLDELMQRVGESTHEENAQRLEKLIKEKTAVDLNSITDEQINAHFEELHNLQIS